MRRGDHQYYTDPVSVTRTAIISDTSDRLIASLNRLAELNVQFDVLFDYQELTLERLQHYTVIVLPDTNPVPRKLGESLSEYVHQGGTLIANQDASLFGGGGEQREDFCLGELWGISIRELPNAKQTSRFGHSRSQFAIAGQSARL